MLKSSIKKVGTPAKVILALLFLFFPHSSFTQGISAARKLKSLINLYPNTDFKRTAIDYMNIIAPELYYGDQSIGQENSGIVSLLTKKFSNDEVFQERAVSFYKDIAQYWAARLRGPANKLPLGHPYKCRDDGQGPGPFAIQYECEENAPRVQIHETAGVGYNKNFPPGWLWTLAMKHSNNNPNLAIDLIGLCGHDNRFQGEKKFLDKTSGQFKYLNCPPGGSPFYVPGSLGLEVNISQSLRDKIQTLQNPSGNKKIPAKYYHVLGESFVACQLIRQGHRPQNVIKIARLAARAYRGVYLCNMNKRYNELKAWLKRQGSHPLSVETLVQSIDNYLNNSSDHATKCDSFLSFSEADLLVEKIDVVKWMSMSKPDKMAHVSQILNIADALNLYDRWFIPCTNHQVLGPKVNNRLNISNPHKKSPFGWSPERYQSAKNALATWMVDFEWTAAQHEIGARFAAAACNPD